MVPCGLAGHMHCIVSNRSHTFHVRVLNLFINFFIFEFKKKCFSLIMLLHTSFYDF